MCKYWRCSHDRFNSRSDAEISPFLDVRFTAGGRASLFWKPDQIHHSPQSLEKGISRKVNKNRQLWSRRWRCQNEFLEEYRKHSNKCQSKLLMEVWISFVVLIIDQLLCDQRGGASLWRYFRSLKLKILGVKWLILIETDMITLRHTRLRILIVGHVNIVPLNVFQALVFKNNIIVKLSPNYASTHQTSNQNLANTNRYLCW
jgi:hypothetical protein